MNATPHHIGCAVRQIQQSANSFASAFQLARRTHPIAVPSQRVRVSFIELRERFYLELVEPLDGAPVLANFMRVGFYHLCFLVEDIDAARGHLKEQGFTPMAPFVSEAFAGNTCQFFLNPQLQLIELAHMSPSAFDRFFEENLES
jgi:hypothetical protein